MKNQPSKISKKTMVLGISIMVVVVLLVIFTLFKNLNGKDVIGTLKTISPMAVIIAILLMFAFSFFEGLNMYRVLKLSGYNITVWHAWKYAIAGFFYSGITPSSSGGQPMQIYYMYQDNIRVSHGLSAVIMQLFGHEAAIVLFALIGYSMMHDQINQQIGNIKYLVIFGITLNFLYFLFLAICLFSPEGTQIIKNILIRIISAFNKKDSNKLLNKVVETLEDYSSIHEVLKKDRQIFWKAIITGICQFACLFAIPAVIYLGFGFQEAHPLQIMLLQSVVFISVGFIPIPGSSGVSEGLAYMIFQLIYSASAAGSAILLGRCLSMYFIIVIYGVVLFVILRLIKCRKTSKQKVLA